MLHSHSPVPWHSLHNKWLPVHCTTCIFYGQVEWDSDPLAARRETGTGAEEPAGKDSLWGHYVTRHYQSTWPRWLSPQVISPCTFVFSFRENDFPFPIMISTVCDCGQVSILRFPAGKQAYVVMYEKTQNEHCKRTTWLLQAFWSI